MFGLGKDKSGSAEAMYREQRSRNANYSQKYEYRTVVAFGEEQFDIELNEHAKLGWELVSFHVNGGGTSTAYYGVLCRLVSPSALASCNPRPSSGVRVR